MGDPRFKAGAPYNVGTCTAGGFDQRSGSCGNYNAKIQSYCDVSTLRYPMKIAQLVQPLANSEYTQAADPYCCNGSNAATHQGYASEYGSKALTFVNSNL